MGESCRLGCVSTALHTPPPLRRYPAQAGAVPTAGCVWLDFELPVFGADREFVVPAIPMWHNRCVLGWVCGGGGLGVEG